MEREGRGTCDIYTEIEGALDVYRYEEDVVGVINSCLERPTL